MIGGRSINATKGTPMRPSEKGKNHTLFFLPFLHLYRRHSNRFDQARSSLHQPLERRPVGDLEPVVENINQFLVLEVGQGAVQ